MRILLNKKNANPVKVLIISPVYGRSDGGVNVLSKLLIDNFASLFPKNDFLFYCEEKKNSPVCKNIKVVTNQEEISSLVDGNTIVFINDIYSASLWKGLQGKDFLYKIFVKHTNFDEYAFAQNPNPEDSLKKVKLQRELIKGCDLSIDIGDQGGFVPGFVYSPIEGHEKKVGFPSFLVYGRVDERVDRNKHVSSVIEAFKIFCDKKRGGFSGGGVPRLTIIGGSISNVDISGYNIEVYEYKEENIIIEDIIRKRSVNIGVVPSYFETFSLVGWEFMQMGIPLILSERTGLFKFLRRKYHDNIRGVYPVSVDSPAGTSSNTSVVNNICSAMEHVSDNIDSYIDSIDSFAGSSLSQIDWRENIELFILSHINSIIKIEVGSDDYCCMGRDDYERLSLSVRGAAYDRCMDFIENRRRSKPSCNSCLGLVALDLICGVKSLDLGRVASILSSHDEREVFSDIQVNKYIKNKIEGARNTYLRDLGRYEDAFLHSKFLYQHSLLLDENEFISSCLQKKARCAIFCEKFDIAEKCISDSYKISGDNFRESASIKFVHGEYFRYQRKFDESIEMYRDSLEGSEKIADWDLYIWTLLCLSDAYYHMHDYDNCARVITRLESVISYVGMRGGSVKLHIMLSKFCLNYLLNKNSSDNRALGETLQTAYNNISVKWAVDMIGEVLANERHVGVKRF